MQRAKHLALENGVEYLSPKDLLSVSFGLTEEQSRALLKEYNLKQLSRASTESLMKVKGIGPGTAVRMAAAFELARAIHTFHEDSRVKIQSPAHVYNMLYPQLSGLTREQLMAVYLNTKNQVLKTETISIGSLNANIVHPREVFKRAIELSAASVIVAHNHPSGDPTPSREDIAVTEKLIEGGKLLGIDVLDHVVIGDGRYVSLKDEGLCGTVRV
jgi:DNA repair protein RadC